MKAIEDSIEHWKRIRRDPIGTAKSESPTASHCALCKLLRTTCLRCPLARVFGSQLSPAVSYAICDSHHTPWSQAYLAWHRITTTIEGHRFPAPDWNLDDMVEWRKSSALVLNALTEALRKTKLGEFDYLQSCETVIMRGKNGGSYFDLVPRSPSRFMRIEEAMAIVYDLASQNVLDESHKDDDLAEEYARQKLALDTVHDFIVNNMTEGDD